jgi:hypothetical protein
MASMIFHFLIVLWLHFFLFLATRNTPDVSGKHVSNSKLFRDQVLPDYVNFLAGEGKYRALLMPQLG